MKIWTQKYIKIEEIDWIKGTNDISKKRFGHKYIQVEEIDWIKIINDILKKKKSFSLKINVSLPAT